MELNQCCGPFIIWIGGGPRGQTLTSPIVMVHPSLYKMEISFLHFMVPKKPEKHRADLSMIVGDPLYNPYAAKFPALIETVSKSIL